MNKKRFFLGGLFLFLLLLGVLIAIPFFVNLSTFRPQIEAKASEAIGKTVKIKGDMSLSLLPTPHVVVEDISVEGLARLKSLEAHFELWPLLKRKIKIHSINLSEPEVQYAATTNLEFQTSESNQPSSFELSLDQIDIENGEFTYSDKGEKTEIKDINLNLKLSSLKGPYHLKGDFKATGRSIKLDLKLDGASSLINYVVHLNIDKESLSSNGQISREDQAIALKQSLLEWKQAKIAASGTLNWKNTLQVAAQFKNLPGKGHLEVEAKKTKSAWGGTLQADWKSPDQFVAWVDPTQKDLPAILKKSLQIKSNFNYETILTLKDFYLKSGTDSWLKGTLKLNFSKKKPELNAELESSPLILPASDNSSSGPRWSKEPLELAALDKINGNFRLSTSKISREDWELINPRVQASIQDGALRVKSMTGQIYGGNLNLNLLLSSQGKLEFNSKLQNAQIQALASADSKLKLVNGSLDLTTNLNTQGKSIDDWVNHLNGLVSMKSKNGTVSGFDLDALAERLSNLSNPESFLGLFQAAMTKGQTRFETYNGDILFQNGIGKIQSMTFAAKRAKASIFGLVNLPRYTLDTRADIRITDPAGLPGFGLNLAGPIDNPTRSYDSSELRNYLVKNAAKKVIEEVTKGKAGPVPKVLDRLFGN